MPRFISRLLGSAMLVAMVTAGASAISTASAQGGDHEDELVVYASHPSEMVDFFAQAFGEKYGISVTTVKAGTGELLNRIRAEKDRPSADIMWGGFADTGASAPDLFDPYESPELANIEPDMIDPKGYNSPFGASLMVIMYNSDILPSAEAPTSWKSLADPVWKDKVVHADPSKSSSALAALSTWLMIYGRDDAAWDLVERMTENMNIVLKSSLVFQQVGRGEYPVGVTYEEAAFNYVMAGTGGIVYPEDGTLAQPEGTFIVKSAPHPKAARLFADYLMSEEAQQALVANFPGRRPTRIGVETHPEMLPLSEINVIDYDSEWASANRDEILERMQQIIIKTQQ